MNKKEVKSLPVSSSPPCSSLGCNTKPCNNERKMKTDYNHAKTEFERKWDRFTFTEVLSFGVSPPTSAVRQLPAQLPYSYG